MALQYRPQSMRTLVAQQDQGILLPQAAHAERPAPGSQRTGSLLPSL